MVLFEDGDMESYPAVSSKKKEVYQLLTAPVEWTNGPNGLRDDDYEDEDEDRDEDRDEGKDKGEAKSAGEGEAEVEDARPKKGACVRI